MYSHTRQLYNSKYIQDNEGEIAIGARADVINKMFYRGRLPRCKFKLAYFALVNRYLKQSKHYFVKLGGTFIINVI